MNSQGYFGPLVDPKAVDEQQLAGHGWVLRGLCEYYEWKHDERALEMIDKIVRNLACPRRGNTPATRLIPPYGLTRAAPRGDRCPCWQLETLLRYRMRLHLPRRSDARLSSPRRG